MVTAGILIFEGVEELDAVGPYQVFGTGRLLSPELFDVRMIGIDDRPIVCANRLRLLPDFTLENAPRIDVLIIPGGMGTRAVAKDPATLNWVRRTAEACDWVASVCTGARITLASGLAAGRRITTHWGAIEELRSIGGAEVLENVRFVRDGHLLHSAGISAGIDMSLWLLGELAGDPQKARDVQRMMEYDPAPPYAYIA